MQRAPQGPEYYASRQLGPVGNELDVDFPTPQAIRQGLESRVCAVDGRALDVEGERALGGAALGVILEAAGQRREVAARDAGSGIDQRGIGGGADGSSLPQHADVDGGAAAQVVQSAAQLLGLQREVGGAGITLDGYVEQAVHGVETLDPFRVLEREAVERRDNQRRLGVLFGGCLPGGNGRGGFHGSLSGGSEAQSCNSQRNQSLFHLDISYTFPDGGNCHPFDFTHPGCIPFPPCRTGLSRQSCRSPKGNVSSIGSSFRRQRYWTDLPGSIECCVGKILKDGCCLQLKINLVHSLIRGFYFFMILITKTYFYKL